MPNERYARRDLSREGSPPGKVKTYTLSAQELAELRARTAGDVVRDSSGNAVKKPIHNFSLRGYMHDEKIT